MNDLTDRSEVLRSLPIGANNLTRNKGRFSITQNAASVIGILLARAMPIFGIAPFGIAFLATERRFSVGAAVSTAMVAIGYISLLDMTLAIKYICASLAYLVFLFLADRDGAGISPAASFGAIGAVTALCGLGEMIWCGFSAGGATRLLCDTALAVIGAFAFERNRGILHGKRGSLFSMNTEDRICFGIMAAIILLGLKSIKILDFFSAAGTAGIWCVAIMALSGGTGAAAVCGILIGLIIGAGGDLLAATALFALCAPACGLAARYGKTAVVIAAAVVPIAAFIGCGETAIMPFCYIDIPLAAAAIIITPDSMIRMFGRIAGAHNKNTDGDRDREYVLHRLNSVADSFRTLAETFFDLSDKHNTVDMEDVSMLFDGVADKVCRECPSVSDCWVSGFNSTYKSMFRMLEVAERRGELTESDADEHFTKKCLRLRAVINEMNRLFEVYKINCVWKSKLCENRELAGEQLGSVAQILDNISQELCEECPDSGAEEEIRARLAARGVEPLRLDITVNPKGRHTAYMEFAAAEYADGVRRTAETCLRSVLGIRMILSGATENNGSVTMRFTQPEGYRIEAGIASRGEKEECGDNCTARYLSGGKYAAALSDGMGTGHRAARDSGATVKLLGDFLEAGFDKSIAVRLVNSIMVMKSANEAFATVDMCVIDLYSGDAEFIKNGAEPSYIKRADSTETVRAISLPVGVMQNMEIESFAHRLDDGDIVVMTSDGLQMKKGHEDWIKSMVEDSDTEMPAQELADRIIEMAAALRGGKSEDDMTVMVLKLAKL